MDFKYTDFTEDFWYEYLNCLYSKIYSDYDKFFSINSVKDIITSDVFLYKKLADIYPICEDKQIKSACLAFMLCSYVMLYNTCYQSI
jgi:hypothetical protein